MRVLAFKSRKKTKSVEYGVRHNEVIENHYSKRQRPSRRAAALLTSINTATSAV